MWLLSTIFQSPPSIWITGMSAVNVISMANVTYGEISGKHLKYSKFWNQTTNNSNLITNTKFSSRFGMLFIYTPSFLAGLASFWLFPHHNFRFLLLTSALTIHFFKRIFEVAVRDLDWFQHWNLPTSPRAAFKLHHTVHCISSKAVTTAVVPLPVFDPGGNGSVVPNFILADKDEF